MVQLVAGSHVFLYQEQKNACYAVQPTKLCINLVRVFFDLETLKQSHYAGGGKKGRPALNKTITEAIIGIYNYITVVHKFIIINKLKLKLINLDLINNPTCRLINPSKSEIGIISKHILDRINEQVNLKTKVNLWKNTNATIEWFKSIQDKEKHAFITFDVCNFYPSISEELLTKALDYASQFTTITQQDRHIIIHTKRSLLYHKDSPWTKKDTSNMFDVTMGSYDGAETCELIGAYMLSLITNRFKDRLGLYRDDGIAVCKDKPRQNEKTKQEVARVFKSNGLKITIDANKKIVNFLDVTFDLTNGSYKPYTKPNNKLLYVHKQSNHPPTTLKNIPKNVNQRLSSISSSENIFNESITPYQKALDESGYNHELKHEPQQRQQTHKKNRKRNITWYNPPWNSNMKTNLGRKFLNVVDKCFTKTHPLYKIFNRHTLKLSYSCMPNMKTIIVSHNKKIISESNKTTTQQPEKNCNCRKKPDCPLEGNKFVASLSQ